jgi:ATP-dependent Lon protease
LEEKNQSKQLKKQITGDKKILLVAQKNANKDEPLVKDLFKIGTVATILQMLKLPDGTVKVLVEGIDRAEVISFHEKGDFWSANVNLIEIKERKDKKTLAFHEISIFSV